MPKKSCGQYVNLFIRGYVKASGIEPKAKVIVNKLKFSRTNKAKRHKTIVYIIASFIETLPEAIGRFFVLNTFASNSLSKISFTIQPADLINIEPKKNKKR